MKRFILLCVATLFAFTTTWAQTTFTYNDIIYNILDESTCEVACNTREHGEAQILIGEISIPEKAYDSNNREYAVVGMGDQAFYGCYEITMMEIPNTITYIGEYALDGPSFTEVEIPGSVKSIGKNALRGAENLTKVTLNEGLVFIDEQAFMSCRGIKELTIPSTVEELGKYVFSHMTGLEKITNLSKLTEIPRGTFQGCNALVSINIPETVVTICSRAFRACYDLKEITLPEGLETIEGEEDEGAFCLCTSLETITIPDKVTILGENSFASCSSLEEVIMGDYIKDIEKTVFKDCTNLKYVTMGNAVENIYVYAFQNCTSLEEIIIPKSVEFIEHAAFLDCSSLAKVYSLSPEPPEVQEADPENGAFTGIAEECVLYVPQGSKEKYESAYGWKDFFDIVELTEPEPEGISSIHMDSENVEGIYSTSGQKLDSTVDGVNIVRYTDGTTKKILVK